METLSRLLYQRWYQFE